MATIYSDEVVRQRAGRDMQPHEWQGKMRIIKWDFASLPAGNIGDILVLGRIRANERLLFGHSTQSGAGAGTHNIGTYAIAGDGISLGAVISANRYTATARVNTLTVTDSSGLGNGFFAFIPADNINDLATADVFLCITNVGTAFTTAARFTGAAFIVGD